MATIIQALTFNLASPIDATQTSIPVRNLKDSRGNPITAMIGTILFATIEPRSSANQEIISFTGITDNGNGVVTLTGVTRNLDPRPPYTSLGGLVPHSNNAECILANNPPFYNDFLRQDANVTITGDYKFPTPTDPQNAATKAFVESIAFFGAGDADETTKGLTRLTTSPDVVLGNPTISIATPAVVTLTAHGLTVNDSIVFSTSGSLPTGITAGVTYYVISTGLTANTFQISTAPAGAAVNTSGGQSGTHTVTRTTPRAVAETDPRLPAGGAAQFLNAVTGMMFMYGSATPPTGFLLCDGAGYAFDAQPSLFSVLGIQYGLNAGIAGGAGNATTDTIDFTAHGLVNGQRIYFSTAAVGGSLPAPLVAGTPYFVVNATTNTFQVESSIGGGAINLTTTGASVLIHTGFRVPNLAARFPMGYANTAPTKVFGFSSRSGNVITATGIDDHANNELQTGQAVTYNTTGTVITGLTNATQYFIVRVTATTFSLATSLANAIAGTVITLTGDGTGVHTFTATFTARPMAQQGGEESHGLTISEMPSHVHGDVVTASGNTKDADDASTQNNSEGNTAPTGGSTQHNNTPLFTTVNYIIKT